MLDVPSIGIEKANIPFQAILDERLKTIPIDSLDGAPQRGREVVTRFTREDARQEIIEAEISNDEDDTGYDGESNQHRPLDAKKACWP